MAKVLLASLVVCLCSLFSSVSSEAQQMTLVQNGQANAQIVIGATSTSTEKYAAQELRRAIEKISGAQLPVVNTISKSTFSIVIGTSQSSAEIESAKLFDTNNAEETHIGQRGKVLFLAGASPRAALYAVYTFLQDQLNCRWFWPGESGEYLPAQNTISIGNLNIRQIPSISMRSIAVNSPHWDDDTITWMARNRMNLYALQVRIDAEHIGYLHERGFKVMTGGHNATLPHELLVAHPEYAAEYGGKRHVDDGTPQLCWSNAAVQQYLAKEISGWLDKNPTIDIVSFFPADNPHFCECDQCKAMSPDVSTRWQLFSKIVMDLVDKTHPGVKFQTLAYQDYRDVPRDNVAPFQTIGYTAYNINYTKPITDPTNFKARQEIAAWQNLGAKMGLRGYQFIPFNTSMYAPIESLIVQEIAWAHKAGLVSWKSEVTPFGYPKNTLPQNENWVTNRMALYAAGQAMWNADVNPHSIVKDWAQHVFGPAAAPMQDYYKRMETAWESSPQALSYFLQPPASFAGNFISDDLLQKADEDFKNAKAALNGLTDDAVKKRIETQINLESAMLDNWRQVYLLQQGRAGHYKTDAPLSTIKPEITAAANDPAWKDTQPLPAFEDSKNQPVPEDTKVLLQWDSDALYLRFINHDANINQLKTTATTHDGNVFGDDAIELFLDDPSVAGHYFHLAINAQNVSYDAKSDGAMNFETTWNPQYISKTSIGSDGWILDVKLPFASFGITPKEGATWRMSFKRDGASRFANSGWPDASYHNPAGFGTVTLVDKIPQQKRVLLYDAGKDSTNLRAELGKLDFSVSDVSQNADDFKSTFAKGFDVVIVHAAGAGFQLTDAEINSTLQPFLQNGGMVLVAGYGAIPLDKWFGANAAVQWSGWKINTVRKSTFSLDGNWQHQPNDLSNVIKNGVTPSSGFQPLSDSWQVLAKL